jgi:hypothetical protein
VRAVMSLVAVVALVSAVTSACGQQQASRAGAAGSVSAPATSPGATPSTVPASPVSGGCQPDPGAVSGSSITVGTGDNGKVLCVKQGTGVMVILRGTLARKWTAIQVSSTALTPRPSGRLTLVVGATGAYFTAAHAGTSVVSSARPACTGATSGGPVSTRAPGPGGTMHCNVMQAFHVTVVVSG